MTRTACRWSILCIVLSSAVRAAAAWTGFVETGWFDEQQCEWTTSDGVRVVVNAPVESHFDSNRPTQLVVYALPNGNTIEQTMGCRMRDGLDWHFDIQNIAAQTRVLRQQQPDLNTVVAYVEAQGLSWPAWRANRPDHPQIMMALADTIVGKLPTSDVSLVLAAHSGGGAFMLGCIDADETIPDRIARIVFLDANYSFAAEQHGKKLCDWLAGDDARQLVVLAYDDREITYQGKKVVGPTGGTFRATGRMRDCFAQHVAIDETTHGPFTEYNAVDGRLQMMVHTNPDNKILHTVLVGELNGYLYALARGTPASQACDSLDGPRAYTEFVAPHHDDCTLQLPLAPDEAELGSTFVEQVAELDGPEREAAIVAAVLAGNVPEHLRRLVPVRVERAAADGTRHTLEYLATCDYLAIGSDADWVRMPMTPMSAQSIANRVHCTLPTRVMVDDIYQAAAVKLAPHPLVESREAVATFAEHHRLIEAARGEQRLGPVVAGIKKDLVLTNRLAERERRVAIYGWHRLGGEPIQPLTTVHVNTYVDYSHGVRLVYEWMWLDGRPVQFEQLATDANLHPMVSDEGPLEVLRYE